MSSRKYFGKAYRGWSYLKSYLYEKYHREEWFDEIVDYLHNRYWPIQERFFATFRYVDLHPRNASVFSYEYASLLRDIGSVFSSALESLVREVSSDTRDRYDIMDYRRFLVNEVQNIENVSVELQVDVERNILTPFHGISDPSKRISWWDAYNSVKHSDIHRFEDGCLSNVLYGFASIAVIYQLVHETGPGQRAFLIGFHHWLVDRATLERDYVFPIGNRSIQRRESTNRS